MTAIGPVQTRRWHGRCRTCGEPGFPADHVLGVIGWLTIRAERMACKAGLHDPFRKAESLLEELSGWSVDAETLRRHTHAAANQATRMRSQRTELPQAFASATGDGEVHIDAGKVNTLEGWRDVKVAVFAVRPRGPGAESDYSAADRLAAASGPALNYFAGHRDRMNYATRLKRGQTIGSGLVEGTIKERVNLRLKRTSARWKAERVGPFVELLALSDSPEWNEHWKLVAA